jgi:hypothetical protein
MLLTARLATKDDSFRGRLRKGIREMIKLSVWFTNKPAGLVRLQRANFPMLKQAFSLTKNYLRDLKEEDFLSCEGQTFTIRTQGGGEAMCTPDEALFSYGYPTVYSHAVSAHAIMLKCGLGLSEWEFRNPPG